MMNHDGRWALACEHVCVCGELGVCPLGAGKFALGPSRGLRPQSDSFTSGVRERLSCQVPDGLGPVVEIPRVP
jgi:hypothetical protein